MNDLPVGRSVDETLRLVQAFQFTDKHGEGMAILLPHVQDVFEILKDMIVVLYTAHLFLGSVQKTPTIFISLHW